MADSTHFLKIQAELDTSSINGQGGQNSNSNSDLLASAIQLQNSQEMLLSIKQFAAQTVSMIHGFTMLESGLKVIQRELFQVTLGLTKFKAGTQSMKDYVDALNTQERAIEAFAKTVGQTNDVIHQLYSNIRNSNDAIRQEAQSRRENTAATRQNTNITRQNNIPNQPTNTDSVQFGKNMKRMFGALGIQQILQETVNLGEQSGMMTGGQQTSSTIAKSAGTGMAAGFMLGPIGGLVGAGVGAGIGVLKDLSDRMREAEDELQQLNEATEQWVRRLREEKKARDEALLSIQQMARSKEIDQFVGQISDLNKKFREIESNVEDLQGAIDLLGRKLQNNEISIADYVKEHDQLAQKLQFEQQLLNKIGQKRLQQIQEEQAEQDFIDQQRESSWDYLNKIRQQDQQYKAATQVEDVSRYGTFGEILQSLDIWSKKATEEQQLRNEFYDKMTKATVAGDFENIKDLRKAYESHQSELEAVLKNRADLAGGLQDVFKELMTYKGLNVNDLGTLAGLGGFGSTSVLGDPMLDLQREQNRLLGDMLRAIREQDRQAKYL